MLKIHQPLVGSCHFADERKTHLAVSANFLRLIRDTLVGIGNLDCVSGREPYRCFGTWRIRQRRWSLAPATHECGKSREDKKIRRPVQHVSARSSVRIRRLSIVPYKSSVLRHAMLFTRKKC